MPDRKPSPPSSTESALQAWMRGEKLTLAQAALVAEANGDSRAAHLFRAYQVEVRP